MIRTLMVALMAWGGGPAYADGYSMKNGRYADGPVSVLALTAEQVVTTKTMRVVVLTTDQQELLRKEAGVSPTVLSIHSLKVAGRDCTCFAYNLAIWFAPEQIEVPHRYLVPDEYAEKKANDLDELIDQ